VLFGLIFEPVNQVSRWSNAAVLSDSEIEGKIQISAVRAPKLLVEISSIRLTANPTKRLRYQSEISGTFWTERNSSSLLGSIRNAARRTSRWKGQVDQRSGPRLTAFCRNKNALMRRRLAILRRRDLFSPANCHDPMLRESTEKRNLY